MFWNQVRCANRGNRYRGLTKGDPWSLLKIAIFKCYVLYRPQNRHLTQIRKRKIITKPKITFCRLNNTKHIFSSARLPYTVQKPVRTGFVRNNRNSIDINCVFKRLQPLYYCSRRREPSISINSIITNKSKLASKNDVKTVRPARVTVEKKKKKFSDHADTCDGLTERRTKRGSRSMWIRFFDWWTSFWIGSIGSVTPPYGLVCWSFGWSSDRSICHNFFKGTD